MAETLYTRRAILENGHITAFGQHAKCQDGAQEVALTDEQWLYATSIAGRKCSNERRWYVTEGGELAERAQTAEELLAEAQREAISAVSMRAQAEIEKGFVSSALGARHTYPLDAQAQSNLHGALARSMLPTPQQIPLMCADESGAWVRRPHDNAAAQQAAQDGLAYIDSVLAKKDELFSKISACHTADDVSQLLGT